MTQFDSGTDWTFGQIEDAYEAIRKIAEDKYGLSYYPNQVEIITSEQMLDAYSAVGMPIYYSHWSFGKQFVKEQEAYSRGHMGLAYEIVINSNPCISYLMEENTMTMQCLVMAHACFGHNSFFRNNVHFKQWTDAEAIIDYLSFAKNYILECEEKYGAEEVEAVLDAAHALKLQGVDRYKRPAQLSKMKQAARTKEQQDFEQATFDDIWRTIPTPDNATLGMTERPKFPKDPEDNLLYFIEKHAPNLKQWKREIIRIVRKVSQYFYPQMLTQIMNEGWATFTHYNIINDMYDAGLVTDGFMLEFLKSHTGVVMQRPMQPINPYALGFAMFNDIKRICLEPTEEDRQWFPDLAGREDWLEQCKFAAYNFKDESFILQYLSPKLIRDFKLFYVLDNDDDPTMRVEAIHNDEGYRLVREKLAEQQNVNNRIPYMNVVDVDVWGSRRMTIEHRTPKRHMLDENDLHKTLYHLTSLWGYSVKLKTIDDQTGELLDQYEGYPDLDDHTADPDDD